MDGRDVRGPLRPEEIEVLRGMMDEYKNAQARDTVLAGWLRGGRTATLWLAAVGMFVLQTIAVVLAARGGR